MSDKYCGKENIITNLNVIYVHYMCTNNLLTIEQFGFRTGHSTELAAIQLVDHLTKQMDMGKVPTNIYINLSKA